MNLRLGELVQTRDGQRGIVVPNIDGAAPHWTSVMDLREHDEPGSVLAGHAEAMASDWIAVEPDRRIGRVVILADMEGITGVPNDEAAVTPAEETGGVRTPVYAAACAAMTQDVQWAIAGARAAGAQEIIVADSHWYDTNLLDEDFDDPVVRGSQAALRAMDGADAAMLIGWHAKAGTQKACQPHTYTDCIKRLTIDGREVGEIGMLTRLIASYGVPVVLVTGDMAAHKEVQADEPGAKSAMTVVTKCVDDQGTAELWYRRNEIAGYAYQAVRALADHVTLAGHHPGRFEVELFPEYRVAADDEVELLDSGVYRIKATGIRESYAAFQRFVDRLPVAGVAPLAR
jgi:D-aminopeptidase